MRKKVIATGNSLAITIDATYARKHGIQVGSLLNCEEVADRLMIQLSEHDPSSPQQILLVKKAMAIKEVTSMLGLLGLNAQQLERMSYDGMSYMEIHGYASRGIELHPITLLRIKKCLARQKAYREPLETSVATVIETTPNPVLVRRRERAPRTRAQGTCEWRAAQRRQQRQQRQEQRKQQQQQLRRQRPQQPRRRLRAPW